MNLYLATTAFYVPDKHLKSCFRIANRWGVKSMNVRRFMSLMEATRLKYESKA